jgi:uncharacterized protein YdeI (YjbR/CyaY-like superfamily)
MRFRTIIQSSGIKSRGIRVPEVVELDNEPRQVILPPDFRDALDLDAKARQFFDRLSYSDKRRFVISIEGAKTAEDRQRRIAKAVSLLREGRI